MLQGMKERWKPVLLSILNAAFIVWTIVTWIDSQSPKTNSPISEANWCFSNRMGASPNNLWAFLVKAFLGLASTSVLSIVFWFLRTVWFTIKVGVALMIGAALAGTIFALNGDVFNGKILFWLASIGVLSVLFLVPRRTLWVAIKSGGVMLAVAAVLVGAFYVLMHFSYNQGEVMAQNSRSDPIMVSPTVQAASFTLSRRAEVGDGSLNAASKVTQATPTLQCGDIGCMRIKNRRVTPQTAIHTQITA